MQTRTNNRAHASRHLQVVADVLHPALPILLRAGIKVNGALPLRAVHPKTVLLRHLLLSCDALVPRVTCMPGMLTWRGRLMLMHQQIS